MTRSKMVVALLAAMVCLNSLYAQDSPQGLPNTAIPNDSPTPPSVFPASPPPSAGVDKNPFSMGGMGGGAGGNSYSATWYPSRPVSGQSTNLSSLQQNLSFAAPLWKDNGDALLLTAGVRNSYYSTNAILPETGRAFPSDLWSINLGLNYMHHFENGWTGAVMTGFGSSSDKPFNSLDVMSVSLGGFLRVPTHEDRDAWTFGVMYSPVGELNFPLPVVSYTWNPSPQFQMNIGLPFSINWRPTDDWAINVSYMILTNVKARVTYRLIDDVHIYAGYEYGPESYFLTERVDTRDRFFSFEQRVVGGVRWDFWKHASIDLSGGYAFNRYFGEGLNQGTSLHDRVDVAPGAFIGLSVRARF